MTSSASKGVQFYGSAYSLVARRTFVRKVLHYAIQMEEVAEWASLKFDITKI